MNEIEKLTLIRTYLEKAHGVLQTCELKWDGYIDEQDSISAVEALMDRVNRSLRDAREVTPPVSE